jgi:hypothetical protein
MRTFAQKQNQPQKPVSFGLARSSIAKPGPDYREHPILHLQRAIGNQAVQRMLQTHAEAPEARSTAAGSSRFGYDFSRIPIYPPAAGAIRTKLAINKPGDEYEQEADRVAEQVMRMTNTPLVQLKCADCEEEDERLQPKPLAESITPFIQAKGTDGGAASDSITQQINATKGSGSSMDGNTQSFMQSRFGADFSDVKIHTGDDAVQMSREMRAQAFTVGNDIFFNSGRYNPESESGKYLLAHELTHVVQQKGLGNVIQNKDDKPDTPSTGDKTKSDDDLNILAAIVATEANIGQEDDIEWVYINLYEKDEKSKSGLNESTPYREKADTYKFNRFLLDDTYKGDKLTSVYFKNECKELKTLKPEQKDKACDGLNTIADVYSLANKSYYDRNNKNRLNKIKQELVNKFKSPGSNPGFNSNGSLDDLNREEDEWKKVRAYLRLQEADSKLPVLIKKMGKGKTFEIVYKKDDIMEFFKNHPDKLPKEVPKYRP